jgi:cathepsin B
MCQDFSMPHCHHHGPQGDDPYPAEGTPGCPQQKSPQHETKCDSTANSAHDNFAKDKWSFSGETGSASGVEAIQEAIMAGGPVETAFTVYMDFANYVSGVYHHVSGGMEGGHAVRIVGWGVDGGVQYWKVANSWNPHWGEKGYFRIKMGECGIDDMVTFSPADAKWSQGAAPSEIIV